jgi:hypothetical protein
VAVAEVAHGPCGLAQLEAPVDDQTHLPGNWGSNPCPAASKNRLETAGVWTHLSKQQVAGLTGRQDVVVLAEEVVEVVCRLDLD